MRQIYNIHHSLKALKFLETKGTAELRSRCDYRPYSGEKTYVISNKSSSIIFEESQ
jgi:hypothetical protein